MFIKVRTANEFGATSAQQIAAFEKEINYQLPAAYKRFLLKYNGGVPDPNTLIFQEKTIIEYLYGLNNGPAYTNLQQRFEYYKKDIPENLLPIGNDSCGNLICLGTAEERKDKVYFLDHEFCWQVQGLLLLAQNFDEFLRSLIDIIE